MALSRGDNSSLYEGHASDTDTDTGGAMLPDGSSRASTPDSGRDYPTGLLDHGPPGYYPVMLQPHMRHHYDGTAGESSSGRNEPGSSSRMRLRPRSRAKDPRRSSASPGNESANESDSTVTTVHNPVTSTPSGPFAKRQKRVQRITRTRKVVHDTEDQESEAMSSASPSASSSASESSFVSHVNYSHPYPQPQPQLQPQPSSHSQPPQPHHQQMVEPVRHQPHLNPLGMGGTGFPPTPPVHSLTPSVIGQLQTGTHMQMPYQHQPPYDEYQNIQQHDQYQNQYHSQLQYDGYQNMYQYEPPYHNQYDDHNQQQEQRQLQWPPSMPSSEASAQVPVQAPVPAPVATRPRVLSVVSASEPSNASPASTLESAFPASIHGIPLGSTSLTPLRMMRPMLTSAQSLTALSTRSDTTFATESAGMRTARDALSPAARPPSLIHHSFSDHNLQSQLQPNFQQLQLPLQQPQPQSQSQSQSQSQPQLPQASGSTSSLQNYSSCFQSPETSSSFDSRQPFPSNYPYPLSLDFPGNYVEPDSSSSGNAPEILAPQPSTPPFVPAPGIGLGIVGLGISRAQTAPPTPDQTPPQQQQPLNELQAHLDLELGSPLQLHAAHPHVHNFPSQPLANPVEALEAAAAAHFTIQPTSPAITDATATPSAYTSTSSGSNNSISNRNPVFYPTTTYPSPIPAIPAVPAQHHRIEPLHPRAQKPPHALDHRLHARNESRADSFVTAAEDFSSSEDDRTQSPYRCKPYGAQAATPERPESIRYAAGVTPNNGSEVTVRHEQSFDASSTGSAETPRNSQTPRSGDSFQNFDGNWTGYSDIDTEADDDFEEYSDHTYREGETELEVELEWESVLGSPPGMLAFPEDGQHMISTGPPEGLRYSTTNTFVTGTPTQPQMMSPALTEDSRVTIRRTMSPYEPSDTESDENIESDAITLEQTETNILAESGVDLDLDWQNDPAGFGSNADIAAMVPRSLSQSVDTDGPGRVSSVAPSYAAESSFISSPAFEPAEFSSPHSNPPSPVSRSSDWPDADLTPSMSSAEMKRYSVISTHSVASTAVGTILEKLPIRRSLRHPDKKVEGKRDSSSEGSRSPGNSARESGVALFESVTLPQQQSTPRIARRLPPRSHTPGSIKSGISAASLTSTGTRHSQTKPERRMTPPVHSRHMWPAVQLQAHSSPRTSSRQKMTQAQADMRAQSHTPALSDAGSRSRHTGTESLYRRESVYSDVSANSVASSRARREVWNRGAVPVVVIPERNTSAKPSREPSLRSPSSSHRRSDSVGSASQTSPRLSVGGASSGRETSSPRLREPPRTGRNRHSKTLSEYDGSDVRTMDFPPEVPQRSSSLSAPASRNNSRPPSLTVESIQAHNALQAHLDSLEKKPQHAVRIEPPAALEAADQDLANEAPVLIPGFAPAVPANRGMQSASLASASPDEESKRREMMVKTPLSVTSVETTGTTLETSEAKAVSIYTHQSSSIFMVDNASIRLSDSSSAARSRGVSGDRMSSSRSSHVDRDGSSARLSTNGQRNRSVERGRTRTPLNGSGTLHSRESGPSTPINVQKTTQPVDSPLRNPRNAPIPPTPTTTTTTATTTPGTTTPNTTTPPTPTTQAAKRQEPQPEVHESAARRSLSLVRRALSRRRGSVTSTTSHDSTSSNFISRAFATATKRDRKYPPAAGGRDVTPIPSNYPGTSTARSNSDPAPRPSSSIWRRPASSASQVSSRGMTPERSRSQADYTKPPSRASSLKRTLSIRLKQTLSLFPAHNSSAAYSSSGVDTPDSETTERRTIARSASGNLRVVPHRGSSESLRHTYLEQGRPSGSGTDGDSSDRPEEPVVIPRAFTALAQDPPSPRGRSKTSQSQRSTSRGASWLNGRPLATTVSTAAQASVSGVKSGLSTLGGLPRRVADKRREKRTQDLRGKISSPKDVLDGVDAVVRPRSMRASVMYPSQAQAQARPQSPVPGMPLLQMQTRGATRPVSHIQQSQTPLYVKPTGPIAPPMVQHPALRGPPRRLQRDSRQISSADAVQ